MTSIEPRDDEVMAQAGAWIVRLGRDEAGADDAAAFDAWLDAAPAHRAAYRRAIALVHEFDAHAGDVLALLEPAQPAIVAQPRRAAAPRASQRRPTSRRARPAWIAGGLGAALAAGLAVAVLLPPSVMAPAAAQSYATGKGQHQRVALADGSVIDLDAETRLRVTMRGSERRITLAEGQAIFDVVHDARRPFVVEAGGRLVRDVGTQFDVRQRAGDLTVTVARGRVEVGAEESARPIQLGPGQRLEFGPIGAGQLTAVDPQETFSWRAGRLVYRQQPLSDVVADLNRQFVQQTTIADPELGKLPITGVVVLDNPRDVMARLSLMLPIRTVPSDKGLMLLRK